MCGNFIGPIDFRSWPTINCRSLRSSCHCAADPFLERAIHSVLDQDYPQFELHIVIDSPDDPAWRIVRDVLERRPADNVFAVSLVDRQSTCSLLCSGLVQFVKTVQETADLIALCPADSVAPRNWLRTMARIMHGPNIGSSLGNRWYVPQSGELGTLVRYIWNAGGTVPMWVSQLPWGGTIAPRIKDILAADLCARWSRALCEDTCLVNVLQPMGLGLQFDPRLVIVNQEKLDFVSCYRFIRRQVLFARMYFAKPLHWLVVDVSTGLLSLSWITLLGLGFVAGAKGQITLAACAIGVAVGYAVGMCFELGMLEHAIRHLQRKQGIQLPRYSLLFWLKACVGIPFTQLVFTAALWQSRFMRQVTCGVRYQIRTPYDVELLEYSPYRDSNPEVPRSNVSVT